MKMMFVQLITLVAALVGQQMLVLVRLQLLKLLDQFLLQLLIVQLIIHLKEQLQLVRQRLQLPLDLKLFDHQL